MKQCWEKEPDKRPKFNDVMEVLEELSETLEGSMLTAMTQETVKEVSIKKWCSSWRQRGGRQDWARRESTTRRGEFVENDFFVANIELGRHCKPWSRK